MPKNFDQMTAFATENIKIAGMRIALQPLLDLKRQAVHAAPHVGVADRQPHPYPRGNRDNRPDNALTTAAPIGSGSRPGSAREPCPQTQSQLPASQDTQRYPLPGRSAPGRNPYRPQSPAASDRSGRGKSPPAERSP